MSAITSYNNDKVVTGEVEYPVGDPASGAFFQPDYKKNDDLKMMLDGSKDHLKLEAMKRIIGMIAKGRDASDLFPAVVKNVVSKNIEVKKLVYVYLVRYAEEQQDLALLSISTFQRALKDPNQLIRASALRVLSSIRVSMIVPIVMLAIRDSASDMSPYVRKTAAHAIPKLYSLDPEQKEELVAVIDKLLSDKTPLVIGSAAMAFSEVCPDRLSLIHKSYRKLCSLLADVDEWGQLALLNVLTVYAKTCFPDPNSEEYSSASDTERPFYESESDEEGAGAGAGGSPRRRRPAAAPSLDPDHRLLLRAARPLLQSRNSGVVMAVAQLYCHCGPVQELPPVAKAMVRLLRAAPEVQSVVLNAVAALTVARRSIFEPYLKSFYVRTTDPTHVKLLKLEILTNLATEASAGAVLRELQTYVAGGERALAAAAVHAVGRLAVALPAETEACLRGLLRLLSSGDEWVVCEAVVVVKRVVGGGATSARAAVARAARLLRADRLAPAARAAAVWLLAEHGAQHPRAAAILAHMLATFADQEELVKLQLLSLAMKLLVTQPETAPLCRYALALARYDASYDVRDRARMLRRFVEPREGARLPLYAAQVFCPEKPNPTVESSFKDRQQYTVGTLSQYIGAPAGGYRPLPPAPRAPLARDLRAAAEAPAPGPERAGASASAAHKHGHGQKDKSFYSEPESSGSDSSSSSSGSSDEESSEEEESNDDEKSAAKPKEANNYDGTSSSSSSSSGESSDDESDSGSSSGAPSSSASGAPGRGPEPGAQGASGGQQQQQQQQTGAKSNLELLLELDAAAGALPTMTPTMGGLLSPTAAPTAAAYDLGADDIVPVGGAPCGAAGGATELFARVLAGGLAGERRWARAPHLASPRACAVELTFTNHSGREVTDIRVNKKPVSGPRALYPFAPLPSLAPGAAASVTLGLDFADTIQPIEFTVCSSLGEVWCSITPPVGELVRAVSMPPRRWDAEQRKLRGMHECDKKTVKIEDHETICKRVFETANVAAITASGDLLRFAGRTMSAQDLVLLSVRIEEECCRVTANCSNMAIASLLANEIGQALAKS